VGLTSNDKNAELNRYDRRARDLLKAKGDFYDEATGADSMSFILREPYIVYENNLRKILKIDKKVLEIGAGTGSHTRALLQSGAVVTVTDISPDSLQVLQKKFMMFNDKLNTKVVDMEELPFEDECFDVVCSAGSLSYGDNQVVMNAVFRVLKPGGVFIAVDSLNHSFIYRFNRYMHYLRGKRTLSTLKRMPKLSLISDYERRFGNITCRYFGSISWLFPILKVFFSKSSIAKMSTKIDQIFKIKKSAFKFVMVARKVE
jgi:ubiquinone/menaquinone biosynthesis C-methylase UbiE